MNDSPLYSPGDLKKLFVRDIPYCFRYCPAGSFMMGSPEEEEGRSDNERLHPVTLTQGFWMLETPVTQEMWQSMMGTTIWDQINRADQYDIDEGMFLCGLGDHQPMYDVTWEECQEFCRRLAEQIGEKVSLPSEAQWEYACRAGSQGDADELDAIGWYWDNSEEITHEVRQKKPNAWRLYDMRGNVWEWCQDWYEEDYPSEPVTDPTGPATGSRRVCRGGCWSDFPGECRCAYRGSGAPEDWDIDMGFRIIIVPQE